MPIRVCNGATRHVLLVGPFAIKVSRVGISTLVYSTYRFLFQRTTVADKIEKFTSGGSFFLGVKQYLATAILHGRRANIQEHRLSRDYPDFPFAKVYGLYCFGTVLVMERGTPVTAEQSAFFRMQFPNHEFRNRPEHICRIGGKLTIIDYGNTDDLLVLTL